jgi:predicted transcriptional regulator
MEELIKLVARRKYAVEVMSALRDNPDGLTWTTITYDIVRNVSSANTLLRILHEAKLIKKKKTPRETRYFITPQGLGVLNILKPKGA